VCHECIIRIFNSKNAFFKNKILAFKLILEKFAKFIIVVYKLNNVTATSLKYKIIYLKTIV